MATTILIPLPAFDFDPTECAVPWQLLKQNDIAVHFSTPSGQRAHCDQRMLTGAGLGIFKSVLAADRNGTNAYAMLEKSVEFQNPIPWSSIDVKRFDGLILPGGHAPGMREYLESEVLQNVVRDFFSRKKPVGAICHGVVLAARSGALKGRKTTALLASQELLAWLLTCLWLGRYYRTYKQTVEAEVCATLSSSADFLPGPFPLRRDAPDDLQPGFAVRDGNYLSARWPGDAHRFAGDFLKMLRP